MSLHLLIVEDNKDMRDTLTSFLEGEGFSVFAVASAEEGIDVVDEEKLDIALIDINLPGKSGFDLVEYIREQALEMPLIALTARDGIVDKEKGFQTGLNDYVVKPFDLRELKARITAHLRHAQTNDTRQTIQTKSFKLVPKSLQFFANGKEVELTQLEFRIMHLLMMNREGLVNLDDLIEYVWGEDEALKNPPIRIHIANLRKKIGDRDYRIIKTIPGTGYIFRDI